MYIQFLSKTDLIDISLGSEKESGLKKIKIKNKK